MRLKHFLSVFLTLLTLSVGHVWGANYSGTFSAYTNATLIDGIYVIGASTSASNKNYCAGTSVSSSRITGQTLATSNPNTNYVWIIEETASGWTFKNYGDQTKYIRQKGTSSGGGMEVGTTVGHFTLAGYNSSSPIGFRFTSADQNSNNFLKWNNSNKWFANYANAYSTSMTPVTLYRTAVFRAKTTQPATGSFTASATSATWDNTNKHLSWMASGATVTLTATPPSGKEVDTWTVTKAQGGTVTVSNNQFTMPADQVTITVTWKNATPAYTITPATNDENKGTVSILGNVITGSPKSGYRYASPAYTVTSGNATVSQNGDEFTVTPESDCTVRINFEPIPTHTVTWSANGNTSNTSTVAEGAAITFPESATGCTGGTFKGWTANPIVGTSDVAPTYVTSATMGEDDITYYAVFADEDSDESSKTYELVIDYSNFVNSGGYGANDGGHNSTATATDNSGATIVIDWRSSNVMRGASPNDTKMQFKNAPGYIYNTTNLGTINSITIADGSKVSSIKGSSENPSSEGTPASYFKIVGSTGSGNTGYATSATINFTKTTNVTTTSNYRTSCCTSLGSINGSVSLTQKSASLSWDLEDAQNGGKDHINSWKVEYKLSSADDWTVAESTLAKATLTKTITGLTCNSNYSFRVSANVESGYCDIVKEWTAQKTTKFTITKDETHGGGITLDPTATSVCDGDVIDVIANTPDGSHEGNGTIKVIETGSNPENDVTSTVYDSETGKLTMPAYDITISATYAEKTSPSVGVSVAALDFESPKKGASVDAKTFNLTGSALTVGTLTLVAPSGYTVSPSSIDVAASTLAATEITVTPNTGTAGTFNGSISVSGAGVASTDIVSLTMTVLETYTVNWYVNGTQVHTQTDVANTDYDEVPSDFSAFDDCKDGLTFIGWSETAFGSTTSAPSLASIGTKITANKDYYAVFAEGTPGGTNKLFEETFVESTGTAGWSGNAAAGTIVYDNEGWSADKASGNGGSAKFGTGSAQGYAITPAINVDGSATLTFKSGAWSDDKTTGGLVLSVEEGTATLTPSTLSLTNASWNANEVAITNADGPIKIKFSAAQTSKNRFFLDDVLVTQTVAANWTKYYTTCPHYYTISLTNNGIVDGKGSFVADKAPALAGESVTLTATGTENAGRFNSWSITGLNSYSTTTNPLTITMPANDITVSATFDALYAINKDEQGGTLTLGANYAAAGDEVTISAEANPQYKNPVLTVFETATPANIIDASGGKFTMPACGVTARVVCEPAIEPLAAPVLSEATGVTYQGVTLNWTGVSGNEGYVLTVQQGGVDVEGLVNVAIAQNATSYTIASGLAANTAYTYSIYTKGNGTTTMEVNTPANGNFSTEDYPTVKLFYSENGELSEGVDQKILTDFELAAPASDPCTKKFVGWSTVTVAETDDEPAMMQPGNTYQIPSNASETWTIYAVYATATPGAATEVFSENFSSISDGNSIANTGSSVAWTPNDNFNGTNNAVYKAGGAIRLGKSGSITTKSLDLSSGAVTVSFKLKGWSDSENTITVQVDDQTTQNATCTGYMSTGDFENKELTFAVGTSTSVVKFTTGGSTRVFVDDIVISVPGAPTYSAYATTCAAAPEVIVDPEEIEATAEGVAAGVIEAAYDNVDEDNIDVALYNDAECSEAFEAGWLIASIAGDDKHIAYTIAENTSYNDARTAYIKLTAPETSGATDPAVVIIPVSQAKKPAVFASLAELAAADVASGTEVTVIIDNRITGIYTNYYDYRYGIYLNAQKYNKEETPVLKDIEIYFNGEQVPAFEPEWVIGGTVSGTLTCPLEYYSTDEVWELKPGEGWSWTDLTYNAPATVSRVTISGTTPDKTSYSVGEAFDPAGLIVHVEYSDESDAVIIASDDDWAYVTWNVDPATFAAEHIGTGKSVSATATYSGVTSTPATVIGDLTVNKVAVTGVTLNQNAATLKVGKKVTLTATVAPANATYKSIEWSTSDGSIATVEDGVVTAVAAGSATITCKSTDDETKTASCAITVTEGINFAAGDWTLVTDAAELTAGSYVIIAAAGYDKALLSYVNGNNCCSMDATKNGDLIVYNKEFGIFEIKAGNKANTIALFDDANMNYLYAASNSNNHMKAETTLTDNSSWSVSVTPAGVASLTAQGTNSRNQMKFNHSNNPPIFSCYSSGQDAIALYKYYAPVPKVTYDKNTEDEVIGLPAVQKTEWETDAYKATVAAGPSRTGYTFTGWNSAIGGNGDAYAAGSKYSFAADITLYAQWEEIPTYSVTYNTSGSTGATPVEAAHAEGDEVTLASASGLSNAGYFFKEWVATYVDGNSDIQTLDIEDGKFTMPAFDVTVTATWARKSNDKWIKVTETSQLVANNEYIIVNTDATYALGEQKQNNRAAAAIEENNGILTISEAVKIFTLGIPESGKYTFKNGGNYLYASSSSKNYLNEQASNDANGIWTISIDGEGAATVTATGTNSHNVMRYNPNNGNPLFSCYTSSSETGTLVAIYYKAPKIEINNGENVNVSGAAGADIVIHKGGVLTVDAAASIGDLTVEAGGKVVLDENKLTVVGTFTIETTMASGKSGQLTGVTASNFAANGPAYIDITLGANGTNQQWHAFTVPFPVDVMNGIYDLDGNKLTNEVNYAIMDYHGDIRATGAYGWKKYRQTLVPGTFYLMTVDGERTTYRFKKKAGEPLVAENSKPICEYPLDGGTEADKDNGWNGLGNPNLFYGKVNLAVQVLDPESYTYVTKTANSTNFVVGTPFFYQAAAAGTMVMETADAGANYAPARVQANEIKDVPVSFGNEDFTDYLYVSANEDALSTYETGKDLVKMTMTNTPSVAQIFGKAYGSKLSMVYTPIVNNQAEVALELYAPQAGEYTISAPSMDNADLYLTYEGSIIWNLSMGEYTVDLNKGTTIGYGLLLVAQPNQMPTGVDTTEGVSGDAVQKILLNGQLYILRDGHLFDAVGHEMK